MALKLTRRRLLETGLIIMAAVPLKGVLDFLTDQTQDNFPETDLFGKAESYNQGSIALGQRELVWLIRDTRGFFALDRRCTHLGCLVKWDEPQGRFVCPCHHSLYGPDGSVLSGPAFRSLVSVKVELNQEGKLIADRRVAVPRGWRFKV